MTKPENHIGLKKGLVPVYFAAVLRYYKKYCVISKNGKELEITAKLLEAINDNPNSYDLYLENWDEKKDKYILDLEDLYGNYIIAVRKRI